MIGQNDVIIQSWKQLCEEVYHDSWKPEMGRYRSDYAFRGLSDMNYELKNSFLRNCGEKPELEYHLLRNFRKILDKQRPSTNRYILAGLGFSPAPRITNPVDRLDLFAFHGNAFCYSKY